MSFFTPDKDCNAMCVTEFVCYVTEQKGLPLTKINVFHIKKRIGQINCKLFN